MIGFEYCPAVLEGPAWQLHRPRGHHTYEREGSPRRRTGFAEQSHDTAVGAAVYTDCAVLLHHWHNARREDWAETLHESSLQSSGSANNHHRRSGRMQPERLQRGPQFIRLGHAHRGRGTHTG
ncbi:hypothetical protein GCM10023161_18870 [Mycobacterium paraffinicum]|uniref:Uncharacterized protein n=1 Tax=Mycobacterium paraffinicum TaxID=53378 RepID=A0ABP8RI73_9MYCO